MVSKELGSSNRKVKFPMMKRLFKKLYVEESVSKCLEFQKVSFLYFVDLFA